MKLNCPECSTKEIKNEGDGIMSCHKCDLIFDSGPQWTRYNPNDQATQTVKNESEGISSKTILKWQQVTSQTLKQTINNYTGKPYLVDLAITMGFGSER